jgi:glutaredoxin 3
VDLFPMVDVEIYTRIMCGYSERAKRLLERKGVAYTEHDASFSPELRQEMIQRANGRTTFPQIFVGDVHVGGSDELHELEARGRLDPLLESGRLSREDR